MNYQHHYMLLIERARNRLLNVFTETHHILPKCLGGDNDSSNLVELTPEEHYLAHLLLYKIHPGNKKLLYAANAMATGPDGRRNNNKRYGWLRKQMSILSSGPNNHMFGKKHTDESKNKISNKMTGRIGKKHTEESKNKISSKKKGKEGLIGEKNGMYGKNHTEETKQKISDSSPFKGTAGTGLHPATGRVMSQEQKDHYKKLFTGKKIPKEMLDRWKKPKGPQQRLSCPHCNKNGGASNMKRYHFEHCKENK
jgi:hypothetical protein